MIRCVDLLQVSNTSASIETEHWRPAKMLVQPVRGGGMTRSLRGKLHSDLTFYPDSDATGLSAFSRDSDTYIISKLT